MFKYAKPLLATGFVMSVLTGCGPAGMGQTGSQSVSQCPEPFQMSDCRPNSGSISCLFENTSSGTLTDNPEAWAYDEEGVQLGDYPVLISGMLPGQKKRQDLVLGGAVLTAKHVVVCSINPEDPHVANRLIEIK